MYDSSRKPYGNGFVRAYVCVSRIGCWSICYLSIPLFFLPFPRLLLTLFIFYFLGEWRRQDWESFGLASIGGGVGDWSQQKRKQQQKEEEDRLTADSVPAVKEAVRKWAELQAGQRILVTTPSVVVGYRCQVYRSEGATQWYTAVIVGHDEETGVRVLSI